MCCIFQKINYLFLSNFLIFRNTVSRRPFLNKNNMISSARFSALRMSASLRAASSKVLSSTSSAYRSRAPVGYPALSNIRYLSTGEEKKPEAAIDETTTKGKLKAMWKKYGYIFIGTYLSVYVATLSSLFLLYDNDIITASLFGFDSNEACTKKVI